jgi:hypothetical protein
MRSGSYRVVRDEEGVWLRFVNLPPMALFFLLSPDIPTFQIRKMSASFPILGGRNRTLGWALASQVPPNTICKCRITILKDLPSDVAPFSRDTPLPDLPTPVFSGLL